MILYRSEEPVLKPELPQERHGTVATSYSLPASTGATTLALPDRFDVYYGMADKRIGVARLDMPDVFRQRASATRRKRRCNASTVSRINHLCFTLGQASSAPRRRL